jgi:hypothetical protein
MTANNSDDRRQAGAGAQNGPRVRGDWALFTDWCHATGIWELPADPATIVAFITDCPAALHRRVAAIDHRHAADGC